MGWRINPMDWRIRVVVIAWAAAISEIFPGSYFSGGPRNGVQPHSTQFIVGALLIAWLVEWCFRRLLRNRNRTSVPTTRHRGEIDP
jgi:hypothetical protein